jgi:predicted MPP superfamily phosphohydrolase
LKAWPVLGITFIQAILILAHWFICHTWIAFWFPLSPTARLELRAAGLALALSFVVSALLGYAFSNLPVRLFYTLASVWLGLATYLLLAAALCWPVDYALHLARFDPSRPLIAGTLFGLAVLTGIYGLLNARWIRTRRIVIRLPNLPASWRGRTAVLLSDLHLGNINRTRFARRIVAMAARLNPDIAFIPGDLFDGAGGDPAPLIAPFLAFKPPLGTFFVIGNHEEFGNPKHFVQALEHAGLRVLNNEKVMVEGVAIAGIPYHDSTFPMRVRTILENMRIDSSLPSILLLHAPTRLPIVEQAGVSLQLSGHTHCGQLFPFTWLTRRIFGKYTYGLQRFGSMSVYTSSGAGTWGPPMRVGSQPEIVSITFE